MRHFIYFSATAPTSGNFDLKDLMKAGRLDIAIHSFIQAVFLSNSVRDNVVFHFIFYGMPDPPKHIEIHSKEEVSISKKDVGNLLKKILYKGRDKKTEVLPGCFVEKKSFLKVVEELKEENEIFILDKKGEDIRDIKIPENCVFILGDHKGLPQKEMKRLKKVLTSVIIGPKIYFASQTVAIVNNELDRRGL